MSWRFARSWAHAEWVEIRRGNWNRPTVWVTIGGTLELVIGLGMLTAILSNPTAGLVTATATVLLAPGLITLCQVGMVAHEHRTALRAWFTDTRTLRAGATIALRRGQWWLHNVHATPTGHGHGTTLMEQVCAAADQAGAELHLTSSGPSATRFYQRHGFARVKGRHLSRASHQQPRVGYS